MVTGSREVIPHERDLPSLTVKSVGEEILSEEQEQ